MQKNFWIALTAAVILMVGLFAATGGDKGESAYTEYDPAVVQLTDQITGLDTIPATQEELDAVMAEKPAVLIEYGDFQCPACRDFAPTMAQLKVDFGDQLVTVFRHFPLTTIHGDAMAAHRASVAAANQGLFWEMHDALYLDQGAWVGASNVPGALETIAVGLGVDAELYKTDVDSQDTFDRINVDIVSSRPFSVDSTPTTFFNGEELKFEPGTIPYNTLTDLINTALGTEAS